MSLLSQTILGECGNALHSLPSIPGASITSMSAAPVYNYTIAELNTQVDFCHVNITLTHGSTGDHVLNQILLPINNWNGRYQAQGGGGFVAGLLQSLHPPVAHGYVTSITDAGLKRSTYDDAPELVDNDQLLKNFAYLSVHETAILSKAVIRSYYGKQAEYSYWSACSTGGRQGMMEAQKYPEDFDGILSIAPAINFNELAPSVLHPEVVMKEEGEKLSKCMLDALTEHAIKACDMDDNAEDGLISDPLSCSFDARSVIGDLTSCGSMITTRAAKIYNTMRQGIRSSNGTSIWYGPSHGTPFSAMGGDSKNIGLLWLRHFVLQQPELELPQMTYLTLEEGLTQGKRKYDDIIGTNNPDLSKFRDLGGKILTWHGMADDAIVPQSTFNYKERVNALMGGADSVDEFYRIFSAPGVGHCYGGTGPLPETAFESLVAWVEEERAPEHLPATITRGNITIERNLCMYPKTSMYKGTGDIYKASSWTCI